MPELKVISEMRPKRKPQGEDRTREISQQQGRLPEPRRTGDPTALLPTAAQLRLGIPR